MRLRPTTSADLEAMHAVFLAANGELHRRHGLEPPGPPLHVFAGQHAHLLEHDAERCWVAEDGGIAGYAAAFVRDGTWFLASLFVLPEAQGRGLGTLLLERVWPAEVSRRLTITDAIQPVSNALYARRGLIPATPIFSLAGPPRVDGAQELAAGEPDDGALAALDRAAYGFDRALDHVLWRRLARLTLWRRDGEPVAYAYAWPGGRIGPVAGVDGDAAAAALRAELARHGSTSVGVRVPGSAAAAFEVAVAAGLRVAGPPGLLLCSRPHAPPDALVPGSYTLL